MQKLPSSPYPLPLAQTLQQQDTEQAELGFEKNELLLFPQHLSQLYFPGSLQSSCTSSSVDFGHTSDMPPIDGMSVNVL